MRARTTCAAVLILLATAGLESGCGKKAIDPAMNVAPQRHEHHAPHGGTPVVLGDEAYHVEMVLDSTYGTLQAYVLDGEMENFVRIAAPSVEIKVLAPGSAPTLVLRAVTNPATGETIGDTALFEARADWLKTTTAFDATLMKISIRGTTFTDVKFNFPKGNDRE